MNKKDITDQIVKLQNELSKLQDLLQDEPEESLTTESGFDCIAVTNVQVFPFKEDANLGHIKAMAQVVLNEQLVVRGLRVMDGIEGLFVSYPIDPFFRGDEFRTVCNPITRQLREHIENCVLEKYQASVDK